MATFTVTERVTFKRCRWQWDWASKTRNAFTPTIPAAALSLGTVWHGAHQLLLDSPLLPNGAPLFKSLPEAYNARSHIELDNIEALVTKARNGRKPSDNEMAKLWESHDLGYEMAKNYETYWGPGGSVPDGYKIIQNEQEVEVPVPGTEHPCSDDKTCQCEFGCEQCYDCPVESWCRIKLIEPERLIISVNLCLCTVLHRLQGQLDALLMSTGGDLFVLERKTFGRHPSIEAIQQSDQMLAYIWILDQLLPSLRLIFNNANIGGAVYDGAYKKAQPAKTKDMDDLFTRCEIIRPPQEIRNFGKMLAGELLDMGNPDLALYNNRRDWEGCFDCSFEEVCTAKSRGEDFSSILRDYYVSRHDFDLPVSDTE